MARGARDPQCAYSLRSGRLAVILLACGLALAALSAAVGETEPNNRPADADRMSPQSPLSGTCADTPDFARVQVFPGRTYTVGYSVRDPSGAPSLAQLRLYTPAQVIFREIIFEGEGDVTFVAVEAGSYFVRVHCADTSSEWDLDVKESVAHAQIDGADEAEHNDIFALASPASGLNDTGAMVDEADPVDMWNLSKSRSDTAITLTPAGGLSAHLATVGEDGLPLMHTGLTLTLRDVRNASSVFAVVSDSGAGDYRLDYEFAAPATGGHQGADEVEPNGQALAGTPLVAAPGLQVAGLSDLDDDPYDWYVLSVPYPSLMRVEIESTWGCAAGACDLVHLFSTPTARAIDPNGYLVGNGTGFTIPAPANSSYYLRVTSGVPGGAYTLWFDAPPYELGDGASLDLSPAVADGTVGALAYSTEQWPMTFVNITLGGSGSMYGPSMNIIVLNRAPVSLHLFLGAGTLLEPRTPGLTQFMITRDRSVDLRPWEKLEVPIWAAMTAPGGIPRYGDSFNISARATGDLAAIANETAGGQYSGPAEMLALWAAAGLGASDMVDRGAPYQWVLDARALLNAAGVRTSLNPPPGPPPGPEPQASPVAWPVAGGFVAAVVGLELMAWRRRSAQRGSQVPASRPPSR